MKSQLSDDFLDCFSRLPQEVKDQARRNYRIGKQNPNHPSLQFKKVSTREPLDSVRIGLGWRTPGLLEGDTITWCWIGSHADYDKLIG